MGVLASDNFTRADSSDLGTNWDECDAEGEPGGFNIVSNLASPVTTTLDSSETYNAVVFPNDQYSKVTFSTTAVNGVGAGVGPTCRATAGKLRNHYRAVGNASGYQLNRRMNGANTNLSSGGGTTFASGDTLTLEVRTVSEGVAWSLKKNDVEFASGIDNVDPILSGRAGIVHSSTTSSGANRLSAWEGGSLDPPAQTAFRIQPVHLRPNAFAPGFAR